MPVTADILTGALKKAGMLNISRAESIDSLVAHINNGLKAAPAGLTPQGVACYIGQPMQESLGFHYTQEQLSIYPSSWSREKGRGYIGCTGKDNYLSISRLAFQRGIVPTSTWFYDNPKMLADPKYAWFTVDWFYTTQTGLWALANAGNNFAVSQWVNGGKGRVGGTAAQCAAFDKRAWKPLGWFNDEKKRTGKGPRQICYEAVLSYGAALLPLQPMPFPLPAGEYYGYDDGTTKSHSGVRAADVPAIKMIQQKVGTAVVDGRFGLQTKSAVLKWQGQKRLLTDGRVGPLTWASFGFMK